MEKLIQTRYIILKSLRLSKVLLFIGILLIILGLFFNEFSWLAIFDSDGFLSIPSRFVIWLFDLLCIISGVLLIRFKDNRDLLINISVSIIAIVISITIVEIFIRITESVTNKSIESLKQKPPHPKGMYSAHDKLGFVLSPGFKRRLTKS